MEIQCCMYFFCRSQVVWMVRSTLKRHVPLLFDLETPGLLGKDFNLPVSESSHLPEKWRSKTLKFLLTVVCRSYVQSIFNTAWKSRSSGPGQSSMALPVNDSTGIMEWWNRGIMGCEGILSVLKRSFPLLPPNLPVFQSSNIPMTWKRYKSCPLGLAQSRALWTRIFTTLFQYSIIPWKWHKPGTIKRSLISTNCRISETFKIGV